MTAADEKQREAAPRRAAVQRALHLRQEAEAFERRWPTPRVEQSMLPPVSWDQLERQLADLTDTPAKAAMARCLLSRSATA